MSQPTGQVIEATQRHARMSAAAGRSATDCPHNPNGGPTDRVLAQRWVRAFLLAAPSDAVSYDDDDPDNDDLDEDDEPEEATRAALDGDEFQAYWTRGKGLGRWRAHPHPWRRLRGLLRKHPGIRDPEGLASTYFHVVFGYWPGSRKGDNPVGPG